MQHELEIKMISNEDLQNAEISTHLTLAYMRDNKRINLKLQQISIYTLFMYDSCTLRKIPFVEIVKSFSQTPEIPCKVLNGAEMSNKRQP